MIYYKDIVTGKRRWTYGTPCRVERGGFADCDGLVCRNKESEIWIPHYLLEADGKEILKRMKETAHAE
jgi:hypothetical protein